MDPAAAGRHRGFRTPEADDLLPEQEPTQSAQYPSMREIGTPRGSTDAPPGSTGRRRTIAAAGAAALVMIIVAALAFRLGSSTGSSSDPSSPSPSPSPAATPTPLSVSDIYRQVAPSVVLVTTSKGSLGSGVAVTDTGSVLTADHVVSGGGTISITFADGTKSKATIAAADARTDVALLAPSTLPQVVVPASLGGAVGVGSEVVAMGNPLGLRDSTTTGVVSGTGRVAKTKQGVKSGLIQFDAAVDPGSSGGPLLDAHGSVIGIVVSIADPGGDDAFAGIGFAVPIGTALGAASGKGPGGGPQL